MIDSADNPASFEEIINFAIAREDEARRFYRFLASKSSSPAARTTLLSFAEEEDGHYEKLQAVKRGQINLGSSPGPALDLRISECMAEVRHDTGDLTYQEALILAMKREKDAWLLYYTLASRATTEEARTLFRALAQEEAHHKLHFETEYDDTVLGEN